jgi:hypothetical protein
LRPLPFSQPHVNLNPKFKPDFYADLMVPVYLSIPAKYRLNRFTTCRNCIAVNNESKNYWVSLVLHGQKILLGEFEGDSPADACVNCWNQFNDARKFKLEAEEIE